MFQKLLGLLFGFGAMLWTAAASAAITVPTLPVTDLESAGTAVLGLVDVFVGIGMVIRMIKKA